MAVSVQQETMEIIVVGLHGSGKSNFIRSISPESNTEDGWLVGKLPIDETLALRFLEPPIEPTFNFIWWQDLILNADVNGYVVLVNSSDPSTFGEFLGILNTIYMTHPTTPTIVAATWQDHPAAWNVNDIRLGLQIPREITMLPCVTTDRQSVKNAVLQLFYRIIET